MDKEYLGDSVYAEIEQGMLKLTTDNGGAMGPSNTIYLEMPIFRKVVDYVQRLTYEPEPAEQE